MVFSCARQQNDEGIPEVVWNHALKNTTLSYMCSLKVQCLKRTEKGLRKKSKYPKMIIIMDQTSSLTLKSNKMMTCFHFKICFWGKKKKNNFIHLKEIPFLKILNHESVNLTVHPEKKNTNLDWLLFEKHSSLTGNAPSLICKVDN